MTTYARLDAANRVIEVFQHDDILPQDVYTPDLAREFVECPDNVRANYTIDTRGHWIEPPLEAVATASEPWRGTPPEFWLLFTGAERVAIKARRSIDPQVDDFLATVIDDQRCMRVSTDDAAVVEFVKYAAAHGLIKDTRVPEILFI